MHAVDKPRVEGIFDVVAYSCCRLSVFLVGAVTLMDSVLAVSDYIVSSAYICTAAKIANLTLF